MERKSSRIDFSRRDFCKGSIVVALGVTSAGVLGACSSSSDAEDSSDSDDAAAESSDATAATATLTLHRGYGAAHGTNAFTDVVVATAEDGTILGARIDEFQFMDSADGYEGVPNSDEGLVDCIVEGRVLMSKYVNSDLYSERMASSGATTPWAESMAAIEAYCAGKSPSELEGLDADAVSGATLVDTGNYLALVAEVAQSDAITSSGTYSGDGSDLLFGRAYSAAHGTTTFADAVSVVQGDVLVATNIDEFQLSDSSSGYEGVPNSDESFGENYADGMILWSKSVNNEAYSANMAERASATVEWRESMSAIEAYCAGKDISDVQADSVDAVSGATLVDTPNYIATAAEAAESV